MAGAFVAVADDATAGWWNPAGLATGAYFSSALEKGQSDAPSVVPPEGPATRHSVTGFAMAFPALGLSYYHLHISEIAPVVPAPGEDGQGAERQVLGRTLAYDQYGASVAQSLGSHVVVGSTVKLLRGGSNIAIDTPRGAGSLASAGDIPVQRETHGDVDFGAMATFGPVRLGASVKHVSEPEFGAGNARFQLARQGRAGVALLGRSQSAVSALTVAFDADVTTTATVDGDTRHAALGAEVWLFASRIGVRGGTTRNTIGDARPTGSVGASFAVRHAVYVDGAWTKGSDRSLAGWAVDLRVAY